MSYPLFEIKLLAALDHAQFEEAIWAFEIDGDISTLLLIDYALEQFHQKKVQADEVYRVPEQKIKKIGKQNLGLEKNESYTFAELLQFLIFTQANDVKDALSNMLFGSIEQTQLILSKRAEDHQLALRAPNQLKNLFLLVKHIYSYPAELKNFSLLKHFLLKIKYINRLRLCLLIRYSLRFYISHIPLDRFISLIPNITGALVFSLFWMIFTVWSIWFLTTIIFKRSMWRPKNILLKQALSIFLEIPILVKCIPKSVSLEGKQMPYSNMDIIIHLKKYSPF
ncbi:hypothetical protein ATCC19606_07410 [Acinetobacter baumannii]|uniref:Uncharacterized protein n=1 Tax=Acinetobacter baumannii TaxID=470 RepID=A0A6F8TCX3_ACIBA|nr:hypothetical protein ATCC19606_07410 [Acinetobacter baumannii]